jgi:hypothetical protein
MSRYGYFKLRKLWLANGGPLSQADIAAAVALAESRGNPNAKHYNYKNGVVVSVDQGLWQINSSNYSGSDIYDPNVNARWAVKLATRGRGWKNWTTYVAGTYRKFLRGGKNSSVTSGKGFGVFTQGNYAGTDQGVDFKGAGSIPALGSGVVTDVGKSNIIEGGSYPYLIYRLTDGPYKGHFVYVAESFVPTVKKGQKLKVGQVVGKASGTYPYIEVGFNKTGKGWNPLAPLYPNPHGAKPAGSAMWKYIQGVAKLHPGGGGGGGLGSTLSGAANLAGDLGSAALNPVGAAESLLGKGANAAEGAIEKPIASELDKVGHWIIYGGAILGGGITFLIGVILLAADIGLSTRAGRTAAGIATVVPAGRIVAKTAGRAASAKTSTQTPRAESNIPSRREERAEEIHQARLQNVKARTKATKSQAKNRRRVVKEQQAAETKSYYKGATDAASPTMAKIRRDKKK